MPELSKLGNATSGFAGTVRHRLAALDYLALNPHKPRNFATRVSVEIFLSSGLNSRRKELAMKTPTRILMTLIACAPLWAFAGPVDINTADAVTISTELNGIGMVKAEAIVEYRKKYGPFKSADDLSLVKGIGDRTVELNRANILVTAAKKK